MNHGLTCTCNFLGAVYTNTLLLNQYSLALSMTPMTTDTEITEIALQRIKTFVYLELANVIFINKNQDIIVQCFNHLDFNVCELPTDPIDQAIGTMLYCKFNAITDQNLIVNNVDISSVLGEDVWHSCHDTDYLEQFAEDGWWHTSDCKKTFDRPEQHSAKVVPVINLGWSRHGLHWPIADSGQRVYQFRHK